MSKRSYIYFHIGMALHLVPMLRRIGIFALATILVGGILLANKQAAADPVPVRLKFAYGQDNTVSSMSVNWTTIQVKVRNIDYNKQVVMHYRDLTNNTWKDQALPFIGHYDNYDVFGDGGNLIPYAEELAVRYNVLSKEYWDNNNENNYRIGARKGVVGGNVMLNEAKAIVYNEGAAGFVVTLSYIKGQIYVQDLSFHKIVGVRWSRDGGNSWINTKAFYGGKLLAVIGEVPEIEIWNFLTPSVDVGNSSIPFQFAVFYEQRNDDNTATVATYWDNNFTQNYFIYKINDAKIQ